MTVFERLQKVMNGRSIKKVDHNTYARLDGKNIVVSLHGHDIILATPKSVSYRAAGWRTVTTKDRLNQWMPEGWGIGQRDFVWYISKICRFDSVPDQEFYDGITIDNSGKIGKNISFA